MIKPIQQLFLLLFCLNLGSNSLWGQLRQQLARTDIKNIAKGILIIRLDNREKEIELLKESGDLKQLKKVTENVKKQNEKIIEAFKKHYTFSKFGFYYVGDSKNIVKYRNFDKVIYNKISFRLDDSLPIYLLFFERKHWHIDAFGHYSFVFYRLEKQSLKRLEKPFPYNFETLKRENILSFFRTRYDFDNGVQRMDSALKNYHNNTK